MHSALRLIWLLATLHQLCWKTFLLCYTTTSKVHHFVLLMLFTAFYELWHRLTYRLWSEWLVDFRFISSRLSVFDEPRNRTLKSSLWFLSTRFCRLRWSKVSRLNHEWSVTKPNLHRPLSVPKKNAKNQSSSNKKKMKDKWWTQVCKCGDNGTNEEWFMVWTKLWQKSCKSDKQFQWETYLAFCSSSHCMQYMCPNISSAVLWSYERLPLCIPGP